MRPGGGSRFAKPSELGVEKGESEGKGSAVPSEVVGGDRVVADHKMRAAEGPLDQDGAEPKARRSPGEACLARLTTRRSAFRRVRRRL